MFTCKIEHIDLMLFLKQQKNKCYTKQAKYRRVSFEPRIKLISAILKRLKGGRVQMSSIATSCAIQRQIP